VRQGLIRRPAPPTDLIQRVRAILDARLDATSRAPIALGLSGGGDSLALLSLVLDGAIPSGRPVLALSVDHGLNPASAGWTVRAGEQARRLGAAHDGFAWRALAWTGPKPETGLPAAARRARHALLAQAARDAGASVLLLGHTADDRAEADLLRAEGGSLGRLRDWSPSPAWPEGRDLFLCRPLLQTRRAELREHLRARGLAWLDDPANDDPRYARTRARQRIADGFVAIASERPEAMGPPSTFDADPLSSMLTLPADPDRTLLAMALVCAGGQDRPPRGSALDRLAERLAERRPVVGVLAGARMEAALDAVRIFREVGEAARGGLAEVRVEPDRPTVWDGRFEIIVSEPGWIRPVVGLAARLSKTDRAWLSDLPAAARGGQPVLIRDSDPRPILAPILAKSVGRVRSLVGRRLRAACGEIAHEREIASGERGAGRKTSLC
jgi:tRNA(Ile)-lysidine synthase